MVIGGLLGAPWAGIIHGRAGLVLGPALGERPDHSIERRDVIGTAAAATLARPGRRDHLEEMFRVIALAAGFTLVAASAQAQAWTPRPGAPAIDAHRYQLDRHRAEMNRLRLQADQREIEARQQRLDARLTRMEVEASRQPEPAQPTAYRALRSPEDERALRQSAGERRRAIQGGVGQIDAWLDRAPD